MVSIVLRRILSLIFVVFSITLLTFIIGYLAPGDPILVMMGSRRDPVLYQRLLHQYGLDLPWWQQYLRYVGGLLQGDLGLSYKYQGRPVLDLLRHGLPISMALGGVALLLSLVIGIPAGVLAALRQNSWLDRGLLAFMLALYAIPSFVLIPILRVADTWLYRSGLPFLPVAGWGTPAHWVLPVIVLAAGTTGYLARLTRASMLEVLRQDFMRTAAAKGLFPRQITWRHAFRNALLPIVTVLGPSLAFLVTGAFVVENLFAVPGIGFLAIQAIGQRDYPVLQGTTIILAAAVVVMNLATDLTYLFLDPRIRMT
ncbi:MAG: ABC transporter permease [Anaerolineae bacterium]